MMRTTEESIRDAERVAIRTEVAPDEALEGDDKERMVAVLRLVWSRRRFLLRAALAGLCLGALVAFLIPQRYEATALLMPPDNNQVSSGLAMATAMMARAGASNLAAAAGDLLGMKTSGALFVGMLHSRTVQDRLIERFSLRTVYGVRLWDQARTILADNTQIAEDRKSGIMSVTVTDQNPQRAAAMARAYVEELDRVAAQVSTSAARREREFIEQRLSAVKADLDSAAKDFSQFASKNATLDIKEEGRAMVQAAAALEGNLIAAESELKMLQQIYTDQNVRVRSVQARVTELRQQLDRLGGLGGKAFAPGTGATLGTNGGYPTIRNLPLLGVTYADLYRRVKIQEAVFEALSQQYEMAKVQEAKEIPSVKVLDAPVVPERKSYPPRLLITALTSLLALFGACAWIVGGSHWAARDPQDPGIRFTEEVIATVRAQVQKISLNGHGWGFLKDRFRRKSGDRSGQGK
jgi:capsule polysaccharide export protein KpsE/RkpR